MICIRDLRYRSLAIDALSIGAGVTSVIGANGSGKTTLLKLCAGINLPDAGSILIEGGEPRKTEIGWVNEFPDRNFLFDTPTDEIASPLRFQHIASGEISRRIEAIQKQFGLTRLSDRSVRELSGGEKVLVALAAAMITNPVVLILDECDSHLDARSMQDIDRILWQSRIPFILRSTQDMENAAAGNQVVFLENNRVGHYGTPDEVFLQLQETSFYPLSWKCRA
ncbi:MAG: energy-coupling factor ABC transporter ATP-binding protein [Methanoregula sp.]|jgi:energy-coupling factor transport system ATP-binding protein|nr:energy-coupling factor ABC transporter ATP-binding protein [Methanoregula sp.]